MRRTSERDRLLSDTSSVMPFRDVDSVTASFRRGAAVAGVRSPVGVTRYPASRLATTPWIRARNVAGTAGAACAQSAIAGLASKTPEHWHGWNSGLSSPDCVSVSHQIRPPAYRPDVVCNRAEHQASSLRAQRAGVASPRLSIGVDLSGTLGVQLGWEVYEHRAGRTSTHEGI